MNILPPVKQVEVISALTEGLGIRVTARVTGVNRGCVASLALRVGRGCVELHVKPSPVFGDQYANVALAPATRAIIGYRTGKREGATADNFIQDLRARMIGAPRDFNGRSALLQARNP
jgi:hypothetical protein